MPKKPSSEVKTSIANINSYKVPNKLVQNEKYKQQLLKDKQSLQQQTEFMPNSNSVQLQSNPIKLSKQSNSLKLISNSKKVTCAQASVKLFEIPQNASKEEILGYLLGKKS